MSGSDAVVGSVSAQMGGPSRMGDSWDGCDKGPGAAEDVEEKECTELRYDAGLGGTSLLEAIDRREGPPQT